ncbi:hypothetical protein AB0L00_23355 [Actinoallomurus sp. NPDC052308]|uniref:fibronectin type III domain-containing protein n=1 Tax=Actinoallomurus sp. NPDC052308 TaxID=3155530 RepID=UPI00341D1A5B
MIGVLGAASIAWGAGMRGAVPRLSDVGAWLGSSKKGEVVHANGLSGKVDGRVRLTASNGHPMRVIQDGPTVLVVDEVTGLVSRIDPGQLSVTQSRSFGAAGIRVVADARTSYVVDPVQGTVQRIDPVTLSTIGRPLTLTAPLGEAAIDGQGTLWVPVPARGELVPIRGDRPGTPAKAGNPQDPLTLTIAAGVPVVTDAHTATTTVIGTSGGGLRVNLPSPISRDTTPGGLLAPAHTDGVLVPMVARSQGSLVVVDTGTGALTTVGLDTRGDDLGVPQALGQKVYIPDQAKGDLIVYDAAAARFEDRIPVSGRRGPLESFVRDGLLWVNDQNSATAVSVSSSGAVHHVGKYDPGAPSDRPSAGRGSPPATASQPATGSPPATAPPTVSPPSPAPPAQAPAGPPGTVTATSGPGYVDVTFSPAGSGTPVGYELRGSPAGGSAQPARTPAGGPFSFHVTGGRCATEYRFTVVALYAGRRVSSRPSQAVRPCVAPGAPRSLAVRGRKEGEVDLAWQPPANAAGTDVAYDLSWNGARSGSAGGLTGTSRAVTGLASGGDYDFTLTASNAAGAGRSASVTTTLAYPTRQYQVYNNSKLPLNVRAAPDQGSASVGTITAGGQPTVPVICQVTGGSVTDPVDSTVHGRIWDRITWNGGTAYLSDLYVHTPRSAAGDYGAFSDPPLWHC